VKKMVLLGVIAGLAVATAGCGVKAPSPGDIVNQAQSAAASAAAQASEAAQAATQSAGTDGTSGGDPSAAMCADSGTAGTQALIIGLQLLAQPNLDNIVAQHNGDAPLGPALDLDGINQGIKDYRVLDGHPAPGFKDPKPILDLWQDLSDRMGTMIKGSATPTQADVDAYTAAMGDQQSLIMSQVDVGVARDEYCKK